jgi:hypothetical protein
LNHKLAAEEAYIGSTRMEMRRPKPSPGRESGSITWHQVQKGKENVAASSTAGGQHSNQQGTRGVWVYSWATGQYGNSAESLVGRHEHANMPGLL